MSSSLFHILIFTFIAFPSTNTQSISQRPIKTLTNRTQGFRVLCNGAPDSINHNDNQQLIIPNVDRRNLLVGPGGLYTTANLTSLPPALGAPITSPDITTICKEVTIEDAVRTRKCCPPNLGKTIKDFKFPTEKTVRMRWPLHNGTKEQVDKYIRAVQAMRDLPEDHPHSFNSQAKIHCAYCSGGYTQVVSGFPDTDIQIHNTWLFFPFHRWFVYFHERILGKLINDPTFALPFWQWEVPAGMRMHEMFVPKHVNGKPNPMYNVYRDARHYPPALVDLAFDGIEKGVPDKTQIDCNRKTMYRDLVRNGADTLSFFGGAYVAGDEPVDEFAKSVGSIEAGIHDSVHQWVGDSTLPNIEDMGAYYSAAFDPMFYSHHSNIDRMWKLWKELGLPGHVEPTDPDWLNASFVFYDENQDLVRVYNKDSVNIDKLKYNFIENPDEVFPWCESRPAKRDASSQVASTGEVQTVEQLKFPVSLDNILKVRVKRPAVNRTEAEKAKANEILLINGIKFNSDKFVKFDVFVNDKLNDSVFPTPCDPEYAGGFSQLRHMKNMSMSSAARFGLTELLEDTNTEGEEYATATLVPRMGCEDLTIGEITIKLVPLPNSYFFSQ